MTTHTAMQNIPVSDAMKSHKGTMFGIPVRDWLTYANAAYLLSLFLTFALTVTLWRVSVAAQNESDVELEKYKSAARVEITQANAQAEIAKREAATAQERTKILESKLAKAKLETAKIQELVKWRTLTNEDVEKIDKILQGLKIPIQVNAQLTDPESIAFAYVLYSVLGDLGMEVGKLGQTNKLFQFGVQLSGPPGDELEKLRAAFTEVGIKLDVISGEKYTLSVGSKLPEVWVPQFQRLP